RLLLPFLPFFVLFAMKTLSVGGPRLFSFAGVVIATGLLAVASNPQLVSWDWGAIESASVEIDQTIPRGSLPRSAPAVLHLRLIRQDAPAEFAIYLGGSVAYQASSVEVLRRQVVSIPLTPALLEQNLRGPVLLRLVSRGEYGRYSFLLFSIIPPPWRTPARR